MLWYVIWWEKSRTSLSLFWHQDKSGQHLLTYFTQVCIGIMHNAGTKAYLMAYKYLNILLSIQQLQIIKKRKRLFAGLIRRIVPYLLDSSGKKCLICRINLANRVLFAGLWGLARVHMGHRLEEVDARWKLQGTFLKSSLF